MKRKRRRIHCLDPLDLSAFSPDRVTEAPKSLLIPDIAAIVTVDSDPSSEYDELASTSPTAAIVKSATRRSHVEMMTPQGLTAERDSIMDIVQDHRTEPVLTVEAFLKKSAEKIPRRYGVYGRRRARREVQFIEDVSKG